MYKIFDNGAAIEVDSIIGFTIDDHFSVIAFTSNGGMPVASFNKHEDALNYVILLATEFNRREHDLNSHMPDCNGYILADNGQVLPAPHIRALTVTGVDYTEVCAFIGEGAFIISKFDDSEEAGEYIDDLARKLPQLKTVEEYFLYVADGGKKLSFYTATNKDDTEFKYKVVCVDCAGNEYTAAYFKDADEAAEYKDNQNSKFDKE